jgi:hypothetical protein
MRYTDGGYTTHTDNKLMRLIEGERERGERSEFGGGD